MKWSDNMKHQPTSTQKVNKIKRKISFWHALIFLLFTQRLIENFQHKLFDVNSLKRRMWLMDMMGEIVRNTIVNDGQCEKWVRSDVIQVILSLN